MDNYQGKDKLREYLLSCRDEDFAVFSKKIIKPKDEMIGVRTPILKKVAKTIAKENPDLYFLDHYNEYFEEKLIHGLVVGFIKCEFTKTLKLLDEFIPYITDWALCDMTVVNIKMFLKNEEDGFKYSKECLMSENPWKVRVGLVLLLSYYAKTRVDEILPLSINVSKRKFEDQSLSYYVEMANGWLLSVCYVVDCQKTFIILRDKLKNVTTKKYAIQKIVDSRRVSLENKEKVKTLRS